MSRTVKVVDLDDKPIMETMGAFITRKIISDYNQNTIQLAFRSSTGWDLYLPTFKPESLHQALCVCDSFLSVDAAQICGRRSDSVIELIEFLCREAMRIGDPDLDLGLVQIGYGPYYGNELRTVDRQWLKEQFSRGSIQDYLVYEYVRQNRKKW